MKKINFHFHQTISNYGEITNLVLNYPNLEILHVSGWVTALWEFEVAKKLREVEIDSLSSDNVVRSLVHCTNLEILKIKTKGALSTEFSRYLPPMICTCKNLKKIEIESDFYWDENFGTVAQMIFWKKLNSKRPLVVKVGPVTIDENFPGIESWVKINNISIEDMDFDFVGNAFHVFVNCLEGREHLKWNFALYYFTKTEVNEKSSNNQVGEVQFPTEFFVVNNDQPPPSQPQQQNPFSFSSFSFSLPTSPPLTSTPVSFPSLDAPAFRFSSFDPPPST